MTYEFRGGLDLERAHARRWVSIIAVVIPVAAFVLLGSWFIRAYVAPPTVDIPNPMMMAAAPPPAAPPVRAQIETPRIETPRPQPPQVATRTEVEVPMTPPVATRTQVEAPIPPPPQTVARAPADTARPVAAEPPAPPPAQDRATERTMERTTERTTERTEQRAEFASALPMLATLTVAPPSLGSTIPGYADPAQDTAPAEAKAVTAENDALEPSEPIAGPIPLPKKKPHARIALFTGAVPLPRPRPADSFPPPDLPAVDRHTIE
jgi:type IV secretory pathway VirB10-like protein